MAMIDVVLSLVLAIGASLIVYALTTPGVQTWASFMGGTLTGFSITYLLLDRLYNR